MKEFSSKWICRSTSDRLDRTWFVEQDEAFAFHKEQREDSLRVVHQSVHFIKTDDLAGLVKETATSLKLDGLWEVRTENLRWVSSETNPNHPMLVDGDTEFRIVI